MIKCKRLSLLAFVILCLMLSGIFPLDHLVSVKASFEEAIDYWTFIGGSQGEMYYETLFDNDYIYLMGYSESADLVAAVNEIPDKDSSFILHGFLACIEKNSGKIKYSVYINGNDTDWPYDMVMDDDFVYIVGETRSNQLPGSINELNGFSDGFLTKIRKLNGEIQYSVYIGDVSNDSAQKIIMENNSLYVFGISDIPNDDEADPIFGKEKFNVFVASVNKEKGSIYYYKQFGGSEKEVFIDALAKENTFLVVLNSESEDFPGIENNFSTDNVIITEVDKKDGNLSRASYFGGSESVRVQEVIDTGTDIYLVGDTKSLDLLGAINTNICGDDVFVSNFNYNSFSIEWSMYLGGNERSFIRNALVNGDDIFISGKTYATVLPNLTNKRIKSWEPDVFVAKINANSGEVEFTTFVDGQHMSFDDNLYVKDGIIYLLGETRAEIILGSVNKNHYSKYKPNTWDGFISRIDYQSGKIIESWLFGGAKNEFPNDLYFEGDKIYIAGCSWSDDIPNSTNNPFGDWDTFVSCIHSDFYKYGENEKKLEFIPSKITYCNYKLGSNAKRTIWIFNTGTVNLEVKIKTDVDWISISDYESSLLSGDSLKVKIQIVDEKLLSEENKGNIEITSQTGIVVIPVKVVVKKS